MPPTLQTIRASVTWNRPWIWSPWLRFPLIFCLFACAYSSLFILELPYTALFNGLSYQESSIHSFQHMSLNLTLPCLSHHFPTLFQLNLIIMFFFAMSVEFATYFQMSWLCHELYFLLVTSWLFPCPCLCHFINVSLSSQNCKLVCCS